MSPLQVNNLDKVGDGGGQGPHTPHTPGLPATPLTPGTGHKSPRSGIHRYHLSLLVVVFDP